MIDGVIVQELKQITDERGKVMHMLRSDSPQFTRFGEIYFSTVNHGIVKAWKRHIKMTQNLAVPVGRIRLVIYDDRKGSGTNGKLMDIVTGEGNYCLITIPPFLWYGFQGIAPMASLIANCTDMPYDHTEVDRLGSDSPYIPYKWNIA